MGRTTRIPGLITDYTGEVMNYVGTSVEGRRVRKLLKDYQREAAKLAEAKRRVGAIEVELKVMTKGRELLQVDEETIVTWKVTTRRSFDTTKFRQRSPWHERLYQAYMRNGSSRTFKVNGIENVDV